RSSLRCGTPQPCSAASVASSDFKDCIVRGEQDVSDMAAEQNVVGYMKFLINGQFFLGLLCRPDTLSCKGFVYIYH
ncbi:hypothetical protein, partial [Pantoea ananatis]|uniref:hypothetical protein n=1 Tax=Pantoea ananas TaxID=553 RepID=UPI001E2AC8BA